MKKIAITLCALAAVTAFAASAFATTLLTENFPYADGSLTVVGAPAWSGYSGAATTTADIQVISGRAVGNNSNAPDDHIAFTAQPLTSPTYACFKCIIPTPTGAPKGTYFATLKDAGTSAFFSRVYVLPLGTTLASGAAFGLSFSSTNTSVGAVYWPSALTYGQEYTVVIKYDPVALSSTMWIDPTSEASPSVSQTGTGTAIAISTFALRQSSTASTFPTGTVPTGSVNFGYSVDNLGVGTTFSDACAGIITPTHTSTWGQIKSIYR